MAHKKTPQELYDLATDPSETRNVADQNVEIVQRLTDQITRIVQRGRTSEGAPQANDQQWWSDLTWMRPE